MEMDALGKVLAEAGLDVSSLRVLFDDSDPPILALTVHGSHAIETWNCLRDLVSVTGVWPVVLGGDEYLDVLRDWRKDFALPPSEILRTAEAIDPLSWLASREASDPMYSSPEIGTWPEDQTPIDDFSIHLGTLTGQPLPAAHIALVQTSKTWEVPAILNFGGWNDCPEPAEQVAIMHYWHKRYGAEVVAIGAATVEMAVPRPPLTREDAMQLAREHFVYDYDIVGQGTRTLSRLAAGLKDASVWGFWWD